MMRLAKFRYLLFCSILIMFTFFTSSKLIAQDTHYWNLQYGTRSTLLGGAVIGSVSDLSATYYNPAALALFPNQEILLSAKVYQYNALTITGQADRTGELTSSVVEPAPSLFAGSINIGETGVHKLGYSILTRQRMKMDIEGRQVVEVNDANGISDRADEIVAKQDFSDIWAGVTWSYKLNETTGIGITQYLAIGGQETRFQAASQALNASNIVSTTSAARQYEYKVFRLIWKLGFGMNLDPLTFGVAITTPGLNLTGTGSSYLNVTRVSQVDSSGAPLPDYLAASIQEDVSAELQNPLSIGAGLSYRFNKIRLHGSLEWFDKISRYAVISTVPFNAQSDGSLVNNGIENQMNSIINYGLGIEYIARENLAWYASFVTDFSAAIPNSETNLTISTWDIYHLSAGGAFTLGRSEFTLGFNYAFGNTTYERETSRIDPNADSVTRDLLQGSELDYKRFKIIFGFSLEL